MRPLAPTTAPQARDARARAGFTLAEVAVTLIVVGIGLLFVLQGLNSSKFTAAQTHNRKVARDLALLTLGQIEAGLFREDLDDDDRLYGNYAEEGYEEWSWEVALGDEELSDETQDRYGSLPFDTYRERERRAEEDDDEDEDAAQPFEKVRIRVVFPKLGDFENSLTLERWMPWENVYGTEEGERGSGDEGGEEGSP